MPPASGVVVAEESLDRLAEHAGVSIAFTVESVMDVELQDRGLLGMLLRERVLEPPYEKDYDALPGNHPLDWPRRFDVSQWGLLAARVGGERIGGAVIAFRTPGLELLEAREDLALLWDLRVARPFRGQGVGRTLFSAAEAWARARGCSRLRVETQNVNVPACRFYVRMGCELARIDRFAYPDLPGEVQLLFDERLA